MREDPNYPTIRQAARRGPLSEYYLRLMLAQGKLPGFRVGSHYRVNYPQLMAMLDAQSVTGKEIHP